VPITAAGQVIAIVLTPTNNPVRTVAEDRFLQLTEQALAGAGAIMIAVALGHGLVFARRITRPVQELTVAAQGIAAGDLGRQVPVRSRDELGVLAGAFNHMSSDLARATGLRRQMTADIAHDLRTPLTVIGGYLEALRDGVLPPTQARFTALHEETQLLLHLVEDLHTLSLADAGELPLLAEPVAPAHLLERAADAHRHQAAGQDVVLEVQADGTLPPVRVDEEQMARVLDNLVTNALRYTPAGGRIALGAADTPGGVAITVRDTGSGIAPGELPHVFERFYRADPSRQQATGGSGLGLAIVHSIVTAHGGQVTVASAPGQGTCFTVTLPRRTAGD
jgi:signal transduction histidine kinase